MMKIEHTTVALVATPEVEADGPSRRVRAAVEAEHAFVWRTLRRLGVREADVDDALQEVFFALFRHAAEIEEGKERGFLFRACEFVAMRARRTLARRREHTASDPVAPDVAAGELPDQALGRTQALERLDRLLDELEDELRSVFVLYEIEEMTMNEIARILEIPPGTVASRLRRARVAFLELAQRDEDGHE